MPRKYTRRATAPVASPQGDAFAAILRPVVESLVKEILTDLAQSFLAQHTTQVVAEKVEAAVPTLPVQTEQPAEISKEIAPKKNGKNGHSTPTAAPEPA